MYVCMNITYNVLTKVIKLNLKIYQTYDNSISKFNLTGMLN